jgi:hypothetical protein
VKEIERCQKRLTRRMRVLKTCSNRAAQSLQQESADIQIQGRALTEEEMTRVKKIESAVELINQAFAQLRG